MRAVIAFALLPLAACAQADDHRLARRVIAAQCGACHTVPGVATAKGEVGPDLSGIGQRQLLAGRLPNSRPNLIRWITSAQSISPGSAMPNIPLTPEQAGAVADYLLSLD